MSEQFLDDMELERERGITIKARSVRLAYRAATAGLRPEPDRHPGHVDFTYEVSRSLAACEGAVLVVDATQGVQAQTLANVYLALDHDLAIVPVLNKIDLPSAEPEKVRHQIEEIIGLDASHAILASAKRGGGPRTSSRRSSRDVPPPRGDAAAPTSALIFDSWFDPYHGAVCLVRVFDGRLAKGQRIRMMATGKEFLVTRVGVPRAARGRGRGARAGRGRSPHGRPSRRSATRRSATRSPDAGASRAAAAARVPAREADGLQRPLSRPSPAQYDALRDAVEKLRLNDSSFTYEPETVARARLRLPLRLPRPPPHGDRAGAPRAGVRALAHHDRADGRLPGREARRRRARASTARRSCRRRSRSTTSRSRTSAPRSTCPTEFLGNVLALCEERRGRQTEMRYHGEAGSS
jgi:GTP-binding protein LepA